ncbi:putative reverse transcriptase domain-containing protein [Tanacetum coccineum]
MAPKRTTRSTPVTPTPNATTTTTVTEAQLQALIDQGVAAAMAEAEANRGRNGYDNNGSGPRLAQAVRECSYWEFLKCKPLGFKGTKGVVELTRWFEKMESVFSISNCTSSCQVKFATCTLQDDALTWWNAHVKTTTPEAAHCKGIKAKNHARGYRVLTELIDEKTHAYAERNSDRIPYARSKPLCSKCDYNHEGPCPPRCNNCKKVGHLAKDCRSRAANANNNNHNNNNNNQKGNGCYECGAQGHFKRNCPKLKNNDRGNQAGNDRAPAKVYVVGNAGANLDNVVAELGSFDAIIGMDWLAKYQAVIVCAEKIVRIPWGNETLIIHSDGSLAGDKQDAAFSTVEAEVGCSPILAFQREEKISIAYCMLKEAFEKEREPPLRVQALVMTISLDLPKQILNAQTEAQKPENIKNEMLEECTSWSIPYDDPPPYEEQPEQLLSSSRRSSRHPEDLVPAKDDAPTPPLPPFFLSPCIRPPCTRATMAQIRATTPSTYHSLLPSGTPPLLPIPLSAPSTSRKADIPEADMPPQKRLLLTTPNLSCEVWRFLQLACSETA